MVQGGRVAPAEVKEYMTLQGRLQDYSLSHSAKVKSFKVHLSLTLRRVKLVTQADYLVSMNVIIRISTNENTNLLEKSLFK